ncbi:MAG: acyl-CoA dehydrogenase family protein [Caldilineaceae bacterium]
MEFALTAEQQLFREMVHNFAANEVAPLAWHTDETGEFNWTAVRKMGPLGMLGLQAPEAYGGADLDTVSAAIAIEELGWACGSTALAISAHNNLGIGPRLITAPKNRSNAGSPSWQRARGGWAVSV